MNKNEWIICELGEALTLKRGHDLTYENMKPGKYAVAGSNGIIGYHNEATTKGPGITMGRSGSIGNIFYYDKDFWAHNTVLYVTEFKMIEPKFAYFLLKNLDFTNYNAGSAVPTLNRNHLHPIKISIPRLIKEQKQIAEILSSLDNKIDLLRRQNKTLERLAETYFRQWFIEETQDDWKETGLDEIADFLNGLALQKFPYSSGEPLKVIKIKELNNGFSDATEICSSILNEKYIVNNGDVIFSWSGSLELDIWKYGKGALNQHLFKVTSKIYPKWFYYYWIKKHLDEFRIIASDKATTMGHIQRHHLHDAKVLIPDETALKKIDAIMRPILEKIELNNAQIQTLASLRNTLLPKLISGEIRVKMEIK